MSKLFKLKEWLTVPDTAKHLSIVFGEEVTEADVLRLALDGHLKLSVNFVNNAIALCGKMVPINEAEYEEVSSFSGTGTVQLYAGVVIYTDGQKTHVLKLEELAELTGIYDLPMIGGERLDVEHKYQMFTQGVEVTSVAMDGAFVEGKNEVLYQLQTSADDNEFYAGSSAQLEKLKQYIANNNIKAAEAEKLLSRHNEDRKEFLEQKKSRPASESYHPAGGLPDDTVLIVRTDALREFEASINDTPVKVEKPMGVRERNTLLIMIAALAKEARIDLSKPSKAGVAIANLTEIIGAPVDHSTIEQKIKLIVNALESRATL